MRGLGEAFVIGIVEDAVQSVGLARREELVRKLVDRFRDQEVAKAAIRIIDPNFDSLRLWRWLAGVSMSRQDLDDLGQTQDLTQAEAARLAEVIVMLGRLLRELKKKTLVLVLDEMERLHSIGPDTITTFVSGFTRLVDPNQTSVSVLIGASAQVQTEMVEVFSFGSNNPVTSRIGPDSQIEIEALSDPDVDAFITGIIAYVRDRNADLPGLVRRAQAGGEETVSERFFPFTNEAIEALKSQLTTLMTPREITMKMTRSLGRAHRNGKIVISSGCIV